MPRLRYVLLAGAIGLLIAAAVLLGRYPVLDPAIIAAEVCIAFAAALLLFLYSWESNQTIESHLRDHRFASGRGKRSRHARRARAVRALCACTCPLVNDCIVLARMGSRSAAVPAPDWPQFLGDLEALHRSATRASRELERTLGDADYPDDPTCDDLLAAIDHLEDVPSIDYDKRTVDIRQYQAALGLLGPALALLRRRLALVMLRPLGRPLPPGAPGRLALRLDRDTYPPGAAIRAVVEADGQFPDASVTVTIYDEGLGEMDTRTEMVPAPTSGWLAPHPLAMSMDLGPGGLDTGQEYTARAECGGLHAEATFAVVNIAPTVQADRHTCTIGDNIAVTVADPAACTGGEGNGPTGTAELQRLVVESPRDRNDDCRLRAVGHSTGIFRGQIRCVAVRPGAAVSGGSMRAVARGGSAEDGAAIACGPDQLMCIRYERGDKRAWTAVFVEGPGAPVAATAAGNPGRTHDAGGGRGGGTGGGNGRHDTGTTPRDRVRGGSEGGASVMTGAFVAATTSHASPRTTRRQEPRAAPCLRFAWPACRAATPSTHAAYRTMTRIRDFDKPLSPRPATRPAPARAHRHDPNGTRRACAHAPEAAARARAAAILAVSIRDRTEGPCRGLAIGVIAATMRAPRCATSRRG